MAPIDQPRSTYSDTLLNRRVVANRVHLIDPLEHPLLDFFGLDGARSKFDIKEHGKAIEWVTDTYRSLATSLAATIASTATALSVSDGTQVKVGDILLAPDASEKMYVTAVDASGDSITVQRAFDGSSAASQAQGALTVVSEAQLETRSSFTQGSQESMSSQANYIQTFEDTVGITDIEKVNARHAIDDMFAWQADKKMPELMRQLERAIWRQTTGGAGSSTTPSYMKGIKGFATVNTLSTALSALVIANIETLMLNTYNAGGHPDTMWANPSFYTWMRQQYNNSQFLRVDVGTNSVGGKYTRVVTPFGEWELKTSRNIATTDVIWIDSKEFGIYEYLPFATVDLPKDRPQDRRALNGTYSIVTGPAAAHARLILS